MHLPTPVLLLALLAAPPALSAVAASDREEEAHTGHANAHMHQTSVEDLIEHFESSERDEWQKPDLVLSLLGDLNGKTVMDLGSGSGYFSFRLANAGARVICADVDERFLAHIGERMKTRGIGPERMELRRVPYDSPGLGLAEVDLVLTVDTYHHFEDRVAYFTKLARGLKPDGRLVVIDFFARSLPVGPPVRMKVPLTQVIDELRRAGFEHVEADVASLPYQYIVVASRSAP